MARIPMLCPFSKDLCRECTIYRGRHYYLCFRKEYRGYLGKEGSMREVQNRDGLSVVITRRRLR
jgi:hypothetical protein